MYCIPVKKYYLNKRKQFYLRKFSSLKKMKLILVILFFSLFFQNSKENIPENIEFLSLSEIFKEKIDDIEAKNNQDILDRFPPRLSVLNRTTKRPKQKYVKGKNENHKKLYRNKFLFG